MGFETTSLFIGAVSFEKRSLAGPRKFIEKSGKAKVVRLIRLAEDSPQLAENLAELSKLNLEDISERDRFSSRSLWEWVWKVAQEASGEIVVDATCLPREPLAMVLFALSVRRAYLDKITILYSSAAGGYATQNSKLGENEKWLSRGVSKIRSIVGFPGNFGSEKRRHVIAFAGHESDRLLETIVAYEPNKLSISSELHSTSVVEGASDYSREVVEYLRKEIALPEIESVPFSASSIQDTYEKLCEIGIDSSDTNVAIVAMNTKLSFIGAVIFCLYDRNVRMVYAVPEKYNPSYSEGSGDVAEYDVTNLVKGAKTIPVE